METLQSLQIAESLLLLPADLSQSPILDALSGVLSKQIDLADLYFQHCVTESWSLEDGIVKEGTFNVERGVGVRAVSGEKSGFAYSDEISLSALEASCRAAKSVAKSGSVGQVQALHANAPMPLYGYTNPLTSLSNIEKIALLRRIDEEARAKDPRITQVMAQVAASYEVVLVAASDGTWSADVRPLVRLNVSVVAEQGGRREQGGAGGGGRYGLDILIKNGMPSQFVADAVHKALVNLEAQAAPAGAMPVVLGPGWPGVLLHEAVGHGLEGDFNRRGSSAFSGRIGERVASPGCTVVDDGTLHERRGSLTVDDEGTPTERTVLIEDGILRGYLQDKLNARLMGVKSTGNGRRESYAHLPMPRMTNTFMLAGPYFPGEIIASVQRGLYAVNFSGGQVDITSGQFVFSASEAYLIEDGRITHPVKGATLTGRGADVMQSISMVGNDLALDTGVGVCGKDGQSVPVGVGQPTLKIDGLVVGGTEV